MSDLRDFIREIQALAQSGLAYCKDVYDNQRYTRLRAIAHEMMARCAGVDLDAVERIHLPDEGYATPKVDLRGACFKGNEVLLARERADGLWTLPGGWADVNETPSEGIVREVFEETGFEVRAVRLYALRDRDRGGYEPKMFVSLYKMFFLCEIVGGAARENAEMSEVKFFPVNALPPLSLSRCLERDIRDGYERWLNPELPAVFD